MRVLILPAILALAVAAPSGELKEATPLAVLPVVTPTIDPGDIQAAAINAQVAAEDQARAAADKITEENIEKVIESESLVKEKTEESFWATEDKKWQALDAVQTAAAKIDGAVASNADAIARSAVGGVVYPAYVGPSLLPAPLVRAPIVPGTPIAPGLPLYGAPIVGAPITPILYTPNLIAKKEDQKEIPSVKTAEPEKDKKVLPTIPGQIIGTPVISPIPPVTYTVGLIPAKVDEKENQGDKTAKTEKDTKEALARLISPASYFYYNPNIIFNKEENIKETEKEIAKINKSEKDKQQILIYQTRLLTNPIYSTLPLVYSPAIEKEDTSKSNEIESTDAKKEENKIEDKPLLKADTNKVELANKDKVETENKDKLEKPALPLVPLVAQPWPLSPVAPVFVPQQVLAHW